MAENIETFMILDDSVEVRHTFASHRVPYTLNAKLNNIDDTLLHLMEHHSGACMLPIERQLIEPCNGMCEKCDRSIFHMASVQQKQWNIMAETLLKHFVKEGDRWEISYIFNVGQYTNHTMLFTCKRTPHVAPSIVDVTAQILRVQGVDITKGVKTHFFKIHRFDMEEAVDCSSTGHWQLLDKIRNAE